MLDLHKIGRTLFKKAEVKPEIVAAIIEKAEDVDNRRRRSSRRRVSTRSYSSRPRRTVSSPSRKPTLRRRPTRW